MNPAPLDDPLSYPGTRAEWSFRLRGDEVTPFTGAPPAGRTAVLAIGSNASSAQLAVKFRGEPCRDDMVGLVVSVHRLEVRPSAHLSRSGYWPFAPAASKPTSTDAGRTAATPAVLCLLDADQLAVLDRSEPNYVRTQLDRHTHPVTGVPDEAYTDGLWVYVSKHGIVDDPRLPTWTDPPPSQTELLEALMAFVPTPTELRDPAGLSAALRRDPELAPALTAEMKEHLVVRGAGLQAPAG